MLPRFQTEVIAPQIYDKTLHLIALWREKTRLARGRPFDAKEDVKFNAFDAIYAAALGGDIGTADSQTEMLKTLDEIDVPEGADSLVVFPSFTLPVAFTSMKTVTDSIEIPMNSTIPRLHHRFAVTFYPYLRNAVREKDRIIQQRLDDAWKRFSNDDSTQRVNCAMNLIVQREVAMANKESRKSQHDSLNVRDELFGFIAAGNDTTSITLWWGLNYLTANQQVQRNLRSALRSRLEKAFNAGEVPSVQEIVKADIPYLDAFVQENNRLSNTPGANSRKPVVDTNILGYDIPKGTDVFMVCICALTNCMYDTDWSHRWPTALVTRLVHPT